METELFHNRFVSGKSSVGAVIEAFTESLYPGDEEMFFQLARELENIPADSTPDQISVALRNNPLFSALVDLI